MMDSALIERASLANVLLVDDRKADIMLTQITLEDIARLKFHLHVARTGEAALVMLQERMTKNEAIDLMLIDINMPEMDGFELLEHMSKSELMKHTAVVMCTGSDYYKDRERALVLGAVGYIVKPVQFAKLKDILETIPTLQLHYEGEDGRLLRAG